MYAGWRDARRIGWARLGAINAQLQRGRRQVRQPIQRWRTSKPTRTTSGRGTRGPGSLDACPCSARRDPAAASPAVRDRCLDGMKHCNQPASARSLTPSPTTRCGKPFAHVSTRQTKASRVVRSERSRGSSTQVSPTLTSPSRVTRPPRSSPHALVPAQRAAARSLALDARVGGGAARPHAAPRARAGAGEEAARVRGPQASAAAGPLTPQGQRRSSGARVRRSQRRPSSAG